MRWLDGITDSMDLSLSELWEIEKGREPGVVQSMGLQRLRHNSATEQEEEESALLHRELYSIFYNGVYEKRIFFKKGWIYVYSLYIYMIHFDIHLNLIQYCKLTIPQEKNF